MIFNSDDHLFSIQGTGQREISLCLCIIGKGIIISSVYNVKITLIVGPVRSSHEELTRFNSLHNLSWLEAQSML